jgi:hypothetical protein
MTTARAIPLLLLACSAASGCAQTSPQAEGQFVEVYGARIHYVERGTGPVVG